MNKINIWNNNDPLLETHSDQRGVISDIFYNMDINHVAMINSKAGVHRGDHYHKKTTQYTLIIKGKLEYWSKDINSDEPSKYIIMEEGDLIVSPPLVVHSFKMLTDNQMMVFTIGERGGKDYEKDTYRQEKSIISS